MESKTGKEIAGTRKRRGEGQPDCGRHFIIYTFPVFILLFPISLFNPENISQICFYMPGNILASRFPCIFASPGGNVTIR